MGAPVLVGAGIGAISSLAMGKDPLMGAAMGGLSGGAFGGSAGFGSGFTEGGLMDLGSGMLTSSIPEVATTGAAQSAMTAGAPSSLLGSQGAQINTALNPFDVGSSMLSSGGSVSATQAGFQAASPMGTVVDNAFINPSTYTGGLDDMGSSGLFTGGGYTPAPQDATTIANLQEYGGLTTPVKTGLLEDIGTTAYDSLAQLNPIEQVQLGQMTLDAFSPEEQQQLQAQMGQIKPADKVTAGTPLQVRPTRPPYKPRFA